MGIWLSYDDRCRNTERHRYARAAEQTEGDRPNHGSSFPRLRGDASTDETVEHPQTTGINGSEGSHRPGRVNSASRGAQACEQRNGYAPSGVTASKPCQVRPPALRPSSSAE